ncbi:MAG: hypothetical protein K8T90_02805 [Planctomycetes bacterium]|nr:hypothetical protein [Planctomycetota bacterium]
MNAKCVPMTDEGPGRAGCPFASPAVLRFVLGTAVLALAAAADRPAVGQDKPPAPPATPPAPTPPPVDLFAAKSGDVGRAAAAKLWPAVESARRAQLFAFAIREARRVVELDPEHKGARAVLGQARREQSWAEDPAVVAKNPRTNYPAKAPGLEEAAGLERHWVKELAAARSAAAGAWATFGDELARKLESAGADRAYRCAIAIDTDCAKARAALGYFRWKGLVWLTEAQVRAVDAACTAQRVDVASPCDDAFGLKLWKVETPHFRIESRMDPSRLTEFAKWLETAYAVHLCDIGREPTAQVFQSIVRMVVCENETEWNTWINQFVPWDKEFNRKLDGCWSDTYAYGMKPPSDGSDETRRDHLVHRAVHAVNKVALGQSWPSWIDEGLAHLTTIRVQGMTKTWCLAPNKSEYAKLAQPGAGKAGWVDMAEWRANVRTSALARDDTPLRTLVCQPFPSLGFGAVLKAWSMLDYWREDDPESFRDLLPKMRGVKDQSGAAIVEKHFGRSLEDIDEGWRRWVLRTY